MKVLGNILKVLAALAAIAGVVYVIATYGDKIAAWAKKLLGKLGCGCCSDTVVAPAEEVIEAEEPAAEEAPTEEAPVEEGAVQAEETDFEG